eukprot:scpid32601/ scgid1959/ Probable RNA-directed DNA polymerase from transposon BS; Reverse transcriptase
MFKAVHLLQRKKQQPITINDAKGRRLLNSQDIVGGITSHFQEMFTQPNTTIQTKNTEKFAKEITQQEITSAARRLNNGRATGPDNMAGELIKYGPAPLHHALARIYNAAISNNEPLCIGDGTLIPLQKPGKARGPPSNLRPIVLLTVLRKVLSLVALSRVSRKIHKYLSPTQSGFRPNRSTSDVIWSYRWAIARCQRLQQKYDIIGIDMSKAFDTISRPKLINVLASFLDNDDVTLISYLLQHTTLQVRLPGTDGIKFKTDRGTPQGDSLSPVLFIVYLELAALRDVRNILPIRPQLDIDLHLPTDTSYADDVDFLSSRGTDLQSCLPVIGDTLKQWDLTVNSTKTEFTHIERFSDCIAEEWRLTRKLGSLLGDREDVSRRMQLATGAFQRLWALWVRGSQVRENRRVKLYNAFITPILLYNCSTWGVPSNVIKRLEAFHRRQLRTVVGIKYPQVIKNSELYKRTNSQPLGETIVRARWRLFGHVLRLNDDVPARVMMAAYFENPSSAATWRGRPRTTLPLSLHQDLQRIGGSLKKREELENLHAISQSRQDWKDLCSNVIKAYIKA